MKIVVVVIVAVVVLLGAAASARIVKQYEQVLHCLPSLHKSDTILGRHLHEQFALDGAEVNTDVFESPTSIDLHRPKAGCTPILDPAHPARYSEPAHLAGRRARQRHPTPVGGRCR